MKVCFSRLFRPSNRKGAVFSRSRRGCVAVLVASTCLAFFATSLYKTQTLTDNEIQLFTRDDDLVTCVNYTLVGSNNNCLQPGGQSGPHPRGAFGGSGPQILFYPEKIVSNIIAPP